MKILIMDSSLTTIKTLKQAKQVLDRIREQDTDLVFDTTSSGRASFTPQKDGEWTVWEPDTSWDISIVLQPAIRMEETRAVRRLYELRKYYNAKWRD